MFEEANLYQCSDITRTLPSKPKIRTSTNPQSTKLSRLEAASFWHNKHHLWVRQWIVEGQVKKRPTAEPLNRWFLYTEYQDNKGNNHYLQNRFTSLSEALAYAETAVLDQPLPNM